MEEKLQKLKEDVTKSDIKVSELLRSAKILAHELQDKKFLDWINDEINGYDSKEPPEYRLVNGEPKGFNPYHGWVSAVFTNDQGVQKLLSQKHLNQSTSELEDLISTNDRSLHILYPPSVQKTLGEAFGMNTQFAMFFSSSKITAVLDTIRNKILDWLIEVGMNQNSGSYTWKDTDIIFPEELIIRLPQDVKLLADEFNSNFSNNRSNASMLILRRILPLSIVRKFQKDGRESEIKDRNGEYLAAKELLGKAENLMSQKRTYKELMTYKMLTDGVQHSYTLNIQMSDAKGAGVAVRIFLDDIF